MFTVKYDREYGDTPIGLRVKDIMYLLSIVEADRLAASLETIIRVAKHDEEQARLKGGDGA
jgi:hypothetical protein